MSDLANCPSRVRVSAVARVTSLSIRKVQELAAAGKLPGAAKLGGVWTFDPEQIALWIKRQERAACREIFPATPSSAREERYFGRASKLPDESIALAYERLIRGKRRGAPRRGASSSNESI